MNTSLFLAYYFGAPDVRETGTILTKIFNQIALYIFSRITEKRGRKVFCVMKNISSCDAK